MDKNHTVLGRAARAAAERALRVAPAVFITGARQTGKSTLAQLLDPPDHRPYLTLDDFDLRAQARANPHALLERADRITIDEVQREPDLLLAMKTLIDRDRPRRPGRFLITGSANLLAMKRVADSLAGRASYITLWPMTRRERTGHATAGRWSDFLTTPVGKWRDVALDDRTTAEAWTDAAMRGGFPVPALDLAHDDREEWFRGYVATYVERDLRDLSAIENLDDFRRVMRATALRVGNLINQSEIARDVGIAQAQVHRYLNLLATSYQVVRLEALSINRTSRLIKTPKVYWCDPALALFVGGEDEPRGAHLENLVLLDLLVWAESEKRRPTVTYWRTAGGREVDFVVESSGRLLAVEVKSGTRPTTGDARHLAAFLEEYGKTALGALLLHTGKDTVRLAPNILAVPWWRVL